MTVLALAIVVVALFRLISQSRDLETVGEPDNPFILVLSPSYETTPQSLAQLSALLSEASGLTVEVRTAASSEQAVAMAMTPNTDAWLLPLFDYLFCRQEFQVQAGVRVLRGEGSQTYVGQILVRGDSGITSIGDLSGRRMGYVNPYSTSGFIYPAALLAEAGVVVVPFFAGSHPAVLAALREGQVDAAATFGDTANASPDLSAIQRTADIPNEPVFFRATVTPQQRERVSAALLAVVASDPGRAIWHELGGITGFVPITDAEYQAVHDVIVASSQHLQDLVPGGRRIHDQSAQPLVEPPP